LIRFRPAATGTTISEARTSNGRSGQEIAISFVRRLLVAAYFVEAGLLLVVAPWTTSWEHNYFGTWWPPLGAWMANEFVRGGVSGVGVITAVAGLRDLTGAIFSRHAAATPRPGGPKTSP
jgi:hypothetical protein